MNLVLIKKTKLLSLLLILLLGFTTTIKSQEMDSSTTNSEQESKGLMLNTLPVWEVEKVEKSEDEEGDEVGETGLVKSKVITPESSSSNLFGFSFFKAARQRIDRLEHEIKAQKGISVPLTEKIESGPNEPSLGMNPEDPTRLTNQNAKVSSTTGFVGPMEMVSSSFYATIPQYYILSPGDVLRASFWGKSIDPVETKLIVDDQGYINVPRIGKVLVSGLSMERFQKNLEVLFEKSPYKYMKFMVTLDQLKSIQISISGEAYRPGDYAVSAATTLFNALYACGGITQNGSLRDIRLLRNRKTIHVDFYDFLMHGSNHDNIPLQPGDIIFIPLNERSVSIEGEIVRPKTYELKDGEELVDLIQLGGGVKATGIKKRIQISTVTPNNERKILDVDLNNEDDIVSVRLQKGDRVIVLPLLPEYQNTVVLEGAVERPGLYELKKEMRISDLFTDINRALDDVFWQKADIVRLKDLGKTTTIVTFNLEKALNLDSNHNHLLEPNDKIVIYSKWDAEYVAPKTVSIYGAVQKPAEYRRFEGMRLKDLIFASSGLLPGYYNKVEIVRKTGSGTIILISYLDKLFEGDESQNVLLSDEDIVMIKRRSEFLEKPLLTTVSGEVKYPGVYALRSKKETISDIIKRAGGLTEYAYTKGAVFKRNRANIPSNEIRSDVRYVNEIFKFVNYHEYQRQVARNQYLWISETGQNVESPISDAAVAGAISKSDSSDATVAKSIVAPSMSRSATGVAENMFEAGTDNPSTVSAARELGESELEPSNRIIFDLNYAMENPRSRDDMVLRDGDTLNIPQRPSTISVIGAVMRPTVITCGKNGEKGCGSLEYYLDLSGGYNADANAEKTIVFRVDGSIIPVEKLKSMEVGDVIYVPTKPMATEIVTTTDKILDTIKYAIVTVAGYWMIIAILAL